MESIYERILPYFGHIFPCSEGHKQLYSALLSDRSGSTPAVVLDVGFGSGEHLAHLASTGAHTYGLEPDTLLVENARRRLALLGQPGANIRVGGMLSIDTVFPELIGKSDMVLIIGNTLPHATTREEAGHAVRAAGRMLAPGGKLVVQTVNYNRIKAEHVSSLPLIAGEREPGDKYTFVREYRLEGLPESVLFRTRLERPGFDPVCGEHKLLALTRAELEAFCGVSPLAVTGVHGTFSRKEWTEASQTTVVIAVNKSKDAMQ